jgi:hypothetical protein
MKSMPVRAQLRMVAGFYALVLATAALLVYWRHLQYVNHPEDVAAFSGGMYAAGDAMLGIFIAGILLVPTFVLVLVIRKSEHLYAGYSKILLGLSVTAPICLAVLSIPAVNRGMMVLGEICMYRLLGSPIVIVGLVVSRLLARSGQAKRLTLYALLIEVVILTVAAALFVFAARTHQG